MLALRVGHLSLLAILGPLLVPQPLGSRLGLEEVQKLELACSASLVRSWSARSARPAANAASDSARGGGGGGGDVEPTI
jgi:hypothetical protein